MVEDVCPRTILQALLWSLVYRLPSSLLNYCWHHNMGTAQHSQVSWNHNTHI